MISHGSNLDVLRWWLINDDFTLAFLADDDCSLGNFTCEKIVLLCLLILAILALTQFITIEASIEADAVLLQAPSKRG